jgi:hypothetical protein
VSGTLITVVVAGLLGMAATVAGGVLTARTSAQAQGRTERLALEERYHLELRSAITEFCTAIMIYRGAELDRWEANHGAPYDPKTVSARVYETRTAARDALYHVELSTRHKEISQAAQKAFDVAKSIKDAETPAKARSRRKKVEEELAEVIVVARDALGVRDIQLSVPPVQPSRARGGTEPAPPATRCLEAAFGPSRDVA